MTRRSMLCGLVAGIASAAVFGSALAPELAPVLPAYPDEVWQTYPACSIEDASSGPVPCRWDASSSGNGVGESFTVTLDSAGRTVFTYDNGTVTRY